MVNGLVETKALKTLELEKAEEEADITTSREVEESITVVEEDEVETSTNKMTREMLKPLVLCHRTFSSTMRKIQRGSQRLEAEGTTRKMELSIKRRPRKRMTSKGLK